MLKINTFVKLNFILLNLLFIGLYACKDSNRPDANNREKVEQTDNKKFASERKLPLLKVKEGKNKDLGQIKEGIKRTVSFTLINQGKADASNISVHDLSQGGCTAVSMINRLAAGDSARLVFLFNTLGYGGKEETRKIRVRYDNPRYSPITLSVTAEILPTKPHQVPIGELFYNFFVVIDVRDEQAFREEHIAGAIHVPEKELLSWVSRLPEDFMIYLYSEEGEKSDVLAKKLRKKGYTESLSIIGGIKEWKRQYDTRAIISGSR